MLRNLLRTSRWLARRKLNNFVPVLCTSFFHTNITRKTSGLLTKHRNYSANDSDSLQTSDFLDPMVFDQVCTETLESLCDYFEELLENSSHLKGADVTFSDGVLTVDFGSPYGTYVINRQTPNKQIWLSSPTSGPKRYDLVLKNSGYWIYKHDGVTLHQLLQSEIPKIVKTEVIEDGNIMDRIPILLQRDLEYYQKNQTVLSETICRGVVGGRLDFPRNASFAAVKIVLWLEDEFSIAFQQGSGMFVKLEGEKVEEGVAKTSDPDKFVQLAIKSSDLLMEHLHVLVQEALDHADLPVLTATLGAAALLKNTLHCYVQHLEDLGNAERHSLLQASYKRYVTMSEAVGERVLDLHNRVLSLYILQDSGGRPIDDQTNKELESGSPSVQGWWLYMQGSRKDLWDTVPPRMAQRIFAGMLNETLTILNVRYCQANTTERTKPLLINDILNILMCVAQLLPLISNTGSDLIGLDVKLQSRDVRDVHAKCNELFKCMVYRGAELHFIHQAFKHQDDIVGSSPKERPSPWFTFVSPQLLESFDDDTITDSRHLPLNTAIGLELLVLLAQPQPSWTLLVKILMMRNCHLSRKLLIHAIRHMSAHNRRWTCTGLWYSGRNGTDAIKCNGLMCTADMFCQFQGDESAEEEYARVSGALTYVLATIGSTAELKSTLAYALEISGRDWAACLDKRQVWCDRRPAWLAGILGIVDSALRFIPQILVNAVQTGASMYQTMSLCLTCITRSLDCIPRCFTNAATVIEKCLPSHVNPVGGSVLLQMLITVAYEELQVWAHKEAVKEKNLSTEANGEPHNMTARASKPKHVRIMGLGPTTITMHIKALPPSRAQVKTPSSGKEALPHAPIHRNSKYVFCLHEASSGHKALLSNTYKDTSSVSFDGSYSSPSSIALAVAEALCSIDEDDKHTQEIEQLIAASKKTFKLSSQFGLEDFPEFASFFEEGSVPGSNAERSSDAAALTSQILMTPPGRDSLRVIYDHLNLHAERIYKDLGIREVDDGADTKFPLSEAPLIYIMFHIGRRPFDQYLRSEWPMPWSRLVAAAKHLSGIEGAKVHVTRRPDMRALKTQTKCTDKMLLELSEMFKSCSQDVLLKKSY